MYRSDLNPRDKSGAIAAVIAIHAALLFALLHLADRMRVAGNDDALKTFDLRDHPPPPPPPPPIRTERSKSRVREGGSAPKNITSEATPIVVPPPRVVTPPLVQLAATQTPNVGAAISQGAADLAGVGTGGAGTGNGSGGGSGSGGGDNMAAEPPHLATPVLRGRDIPDDILEQWPRGATVFMRLRVDPRGYVAECTIDRGSGIPDVDNSLCNIAHERLRFRPAVNRSGQAVAGWFGYAQPAPR